MTKKCLTSLSNSKLLFTTNNKRLDIKLFYIKLKKNYYIVMKFKTTLIAFLSILLSSVSAQSRLVQSVEIEWKGVEKMYADSLYSRFITFEGARYPAENKLPYFFNKIACDSVSFYDVTLENPQFIPATPEEIELINLNELPTKADIRINTITEDGNNYFSVQILPIINLNGKIVKLHTFNLQLKKRDNPRKVTSAISKRSYTNNSVLAQGKFAKIRIIESGVYKLTYEDLSSMGINPANVRIFGYGGAVLDENLTGQKSDDLPEVAIWVEKGTDGVFNAGDYILFYGQGVVKWKYDNLKSMFTHTTNSYSKYGYYFVTSDAGIGKKIEEKTIEIPTSATIYPIEEFLDYQVHEKDNQHLVESGKEFYGEIFGEITTHGFIFNFPNPVLSNSTITRLDVVNTASTGTFFSLNLNGAQTQTLVAGGKSDDRYEFGKASSGIYRFTPQNENLTFNITYNKPSLSATAYLNFLEVNTRRKLKMTGTAMQFQNVDNLNKAAYNQYLLSDANSNIQIWDITDQQNISRMKTQLVNGKMSFTSSGNNVTKYLAIDPTAKNSFPTPEIEGNVANQNIHAINQADLMIITHPEFLTQAQKLAQAHREKDNLTAEVVTTEQVYNEFSSGTPDATAYRWIMKMLYDRATNNADLPKYLLLFGRGSFDNKKTFSKNADNYILTYQADNSLSITSSYVTDDYFGILKDSIQITSDPLNLGVGRLPVTSTQQATDVVNKIIVYMENKSKTNWKNQLCFVADDGDNSLHIGQADGIAETLIKKYPEFQINKIYLDAYQQEISASGETYPLAKNRFMNLLRSGLLYLNYTGHAGPTGWANESILSLADVKALSNEHQPFVLGATCDFLEFDKFEVSGGEHMLLNPIGGCIGILSAARPVYSSQNQVLNKLICDNLLKRTNGEYKRIGDIISTAKNGIGSEINKLSYIFMGDPALKLNYPTKYRVVTSSINESTNLGSDTLRALSVATIKGYITKNESGDKVTNFNGTIQAVIYDKIQKITTLNNEKDGAFVYSDRPNTLFSGKAEVKNGEFTISFMLPKDIKYNYGTGRINYYASDNTNNYEAQGYFENFLVGGTDKNYINELIGPTVKLYLNSENFVSGNKVNEEPLFIANVSDTNGINTVGSGIGHDVMLTIDQDPTQSYILNDYFQAKENSYSEGTIRYKLPEMSNGKHTLTFRVWDLLNNSTTQSINFEVEKGLTPTIFNTYNFPNPVKSETNIIVEHDRPETILKTSVEIFDLSGRKIWSFSQASAKNIKWNLAGDDGITVKTGVYFYRVTIKTANSDSYSKTNKMLITEQ